MRGRTSSSACSCSTGCRGMAGADDRSVARRARGRSPTTGCATSSTYARGSVVRRVPLTAHDVEYGIKRVLTQQPGGSVAIYFVLENGQDYYLGRSDDADAIGVRALDDRTVEFRLVAPAPYFMSVMNRPDGGPRRATRSRRTAPTGPTRPPSRQRSVSAVERTEAASCWSGERPLGRPATSSSRVLPFRSRRACRG